MPPQLLTPSSPVGWGASGYAVSPPAPMGNVYGVPSIGVQSYIPLGYKRPLEPSEQLAVEQGLRRWIPKLGAGYSTPIPQLLASPGKSAIISGLMGGGFAGIMALFFAITSHLKGALALTITVGAAAILGTIGAVEGFFSRRKTNEDYLDIMARFPVGATKRDLESDPAYQAQLTRLAAQAGGSSAASANTLSALALMTAMSSSANSGGRSSSRGGSYRSFHA
ncbi:MAG: hypothetical protein SFZ03_11600 [Candidatus Melainabacteria bacterium]|nr:hypothetical protein [Candidatus Melainabacteria bacterium]